MTSSDPPAEPSAAQVAEADRIRKNFQRRDAKAQGRTLATGSELLARERRERTELIVRRELPGVPFPTILDVGCGGGADLAHWQAAGWPKERLAGIDLVPARVEGALRRCPGVDIRLGTGGPLPFAADGFDVATAATVFSSIADREARGALFAEIRRVVRPGGLIVVYDFVVRNPRNRDVVAMTPRRLVEMANRPPLGFERLSPFLYAVSLGLRLNSRVGLAIARIAPRTHRLSYWRVEPEN